jgi:hypothetical protein
MVVPATTAPAKIMLGSFKMQKQFTKTARRQIEIYLQQLEIEGDLKTSLATSIIAAHDVKVTEIKAPLDFENIFAFDVYEIGFGGKGSYHALQPSQYGRRIICIPIPRTL